MGRKLQSNVILRNLDCSRQNKEYLTSKGKIHSIKRLGENMLYRVWDIETELAVKVFV